MEWSGVEWNGMGWSAVERNGVEWSGVEWNGMEWSGVEWNGARDDLLGSGMESSGVEWNGMEWNGASRYRGLNLISPVVGLSLPVIMLSSVDLPAPLLPTMQTRLCWSTPKLRSLKRCGRCGAYWKSASFTCDGGADGRTRARTAAACVRARVRGAPPTAA